MPSSKKLSIKEIARLVNCSPATVSNVLNNRRNFGKETRERILEVCKMAGYAPNAAGRRLRTGKTECVGLIFSRVAADIFKSAFYMELMHALQKKLSEHKYDILLSEYLLENGDISLPRAASEGKVDALIILGGMDKRLLEILKTAKLRTIVVDSFCDGLDSITSDGRTATKNMVELLSKNGHENLAYFAYDYEDFNTDERIAGFKEGAKKFGIKSRKVFKKFTDKNLVCDEFEKMMSSENPPSAVLCVNDELAYSIISRAKKIGIKVPEELCVWGYDDTNFANIGNISTAHVNISEMGSRAAEMTIERINNPELPARKIYSPAPLILRKSSGRSGRARRA